MLTFKMITYKDGFYHYEYYPEGKKKNKGIIIFNPNTNEIIKDVKPDTGINYRTKFLNGVLDENKQFKESGMVAWG